MSGAHFKDAVDLMRAVEHLNFGVLASTKPNSKGDGTLIASVEAEFKHKLDKAQEHWKETDALTSLYEKTITEAQSALDDGAYQKALELVRAAEALAPVHLHNNEESARAT